MSEKSEKILKQWLPTEAINEIDLWVAKYPAEQKQSAVMHALMLAQEAQGHLTDALMNAVADYLDMPPIAVYEVATFYSMYQLSPVGKHSINVCTNISCKLRQADKIVDSLEEKLDIKLGETTKDGRFTLKAVECLGACVNAPMMQVDKDYHENLTPESLDDILEQYR